MSDKRSTCRGCGAYIEFIKTTKGKWMPVDPESLDPDDCEPTDIIVSKDGTCKQARHVPPSARYATIWHISHFATCSKADNFRNSGREKTRAGK